MHNFCYKVRHRLRRPAASWHAMRGTALVGLSSTVRGYNPRLLHKGILQLSEALEEIPDGSRSRARILNNLSEALRMEQVGQAIGDFDEAIEVAEEAVAFTPDGRQGRSTMLCTLSVGLLSRFASNCNAADLDRAINVGAQAVDSTTPGRPQRALFLSNLCLCLAVRFLETGRLSDLDRAIDLGGQAVETTSRRHPKRFMFLVNLSFALRYRFERKGLPADLDRAITLNKEALDRTPLNSPVRDPMMCNLGAMVRIRFQRTGDLSELDDSIRILDEVTEGRRGPNAAVAMSHLCVALRLRFEHTNRLADLQRAIDEGRRALSMIPRHHSSETLVLSNLGVALRRSFDHTGRDSDLKEAIKILESAVESEKAEPWRRALAAQEWAEAAELAGEPTLAIKAYTVAVELLGRMAPRELDRSDQEHELARLTGVGPAAAAACLQAAAGKDLSEQQVAILHGRAVELLEQARGVLFARVLDSRTDLTDLLRTHPDLGQRVLNAEVQLSHRSINVETPFVGYSQAAAELSLTERRRQAALDLEVALAEVREQPGFRSFQMPRPVGDLLPTPAEGPRVIVNVALQRCDALILTAFRVEVVPLPALSPPTVRGRVNQFLAAINRIYGVGSNPVDRLAAEDDLADLLAWLWDAVAGPVLSRLGINAKPKQAEPWPRVQWCPTGLLAFLPLHAAGHHDTHGSPYPLTVMDLVVSSTIPTLRALIQAGRAADLIHEREGETEDVYRVLVVAMPHTPGEEDLPGAQQEASIVSRLLPGRVDVLGLPATEPARHDNVLAALPGHAWAHFACHGADNMINPSDSRLLLDDWMTRPLTVLDLTNTALEDAQLAFLSACTTARTGARLPDEPIHLSAACRLAGYRHVIATLWPIHDDDAVRVTRSVYSQLASGGKSADNAAQALHKALAALRDLHPGKPSRWAAYSHSGS